MERMVMWLAAVLALPLACANVIGIDFGTENMKVALVQPGSPLEIVTNTVSKRKTETVLAFVRGERLFGSDAYGMLSRQPMLTYSRLNQLLGKTLEHPSVSRLAQTYLPMKVRFNESRGALALGAQPSSTAQYGEDGGWDEWGVEELVAMILTYAKDITKAYGGHSVRDCVITVSSFATQLEREALIAAAELADLRVLTLLEENTAAALHFGLDRLYEEPKRVLFYNLGADAAQVSVVEYSTWTEKSGGKNKTIGQLEVLGKGWETGVGGHALDLALAEEVAKGFNAQWKKGDIREVPKAMAKIMAAAKKTKEVLSANAEIPMNIPSLHDDIDFRMSFSRAQLEKLAEGVLSKLELPIIAALKAANLTADDVDQVEIIGGGVRVPKVQQTLKEFFAQNCLNETKRTVELGVHLNGDEAVALGAAFLGANVSTSFRVRKVGLIDHSPFAIGVRMNNDPNGKTLAQVLEEEEKGVLGGLFGKKKKQQDIAVVEEEWNKKATLYKAGSVLGGKKTIAFQHDADILVELAYEQDDLLPPSTPLVVAQYNVSGVAAFAAEMVKLNKTGQLPGPKVSLSFTLDSSGITQLSKAEVSVVEEYEVEVVNDPPPVKKQKKSKNETNTTTDVNATAATEEAVEEAVEEPAAAEEEETPVVEEEEETPAAEEETTPTDAAPPLNKTMVTKKRTHKRTLTVTPSVHSRFAWATMAGDAEHMAVRLRSIGAAEQKRMAREAAKNDLESSIYSTRSELDDRSDLAAVSTEEQREAVMSECNKLAEWLDDESEGAETELIVSKRSELLRSINAIVERADEASRRPAAVEKARKALGLALKNATEVWPVERPWLNLTDLEDLVTKVGKASTWLDETLKSQAALEAWEKPAFSVGEIPTKLKPVATLASKLLSKSKPKPPAPPKAPESNSTDNATDANSTETEERPDEEAAPEEAATWDEL